MHRGVVIEDAAGTGRRIANQRAIHEKRIGVVLSTVGEEPAENARNSASGRAVTDEQAICESGNSLARHEDSTATHRRAVIAEDAFRNSNGGIRRTALEIDNAARFRFVALEEGIGDLTASKPKRTSTFCTVSPKLATDNRYGPR